MSNEADSRFPSVLAAALHDAFRRALPDAPYTATVEDDQLVLTLPAANPEVGELTIWIDEDEITIGIGEHFHCHFPTYLHDDVAPSNAQQEAVEQAVAYVLDVLNNRIVLQIHSEGGQVRWSGTYHLDRYPEWKTSPGTRQYLWSGPLKSM